MILAASKINTRDPSKGMSCLQLLEKNNRLGAEAAATESLLTNLTSKEQLAVNQSELANSKPQRSGRAKPFETANKYN